MALLGIDLGTSGTKAVLIDHDGAVRAVGASGHPPRSPVPGFVEADVESWWSAAGAAVHQALRVAPRDFVVEGISLSGQMHGVVLVDRRREALRPALLWPDTRASTVLAAFRERCAGIEERLGNPIVPGMTGPLLLWLGRHEPETLARASWVLSPKDWLRLRLVDDVATDPSDASATLLWDVPADDCAHALAESLGVGALLPPVRASAEVAGTLTRAAAAHLGLPKGLPVIVGAGDAAAAALGNGLVAPPAALLTVGTGGQVLALLDRPVLDLTRRTHCYRVAGPGWYAMAAVQNVGLALEWVITTLGVGWGEAYERAFAVSPGARDVTFLPYLTGERTPHLDPGLRAAWSGMALDHDRDVLLRAAFEGVAFALRDGVDALASAGHTFPSLRLAGGGSGDSRWRALLATVLGVPLHSVEVPHASGCGAALLAGVGVGVWASITAAAAASRPPLVTTEPVEQDVMALEQALGRFRHAATAAVSPARSI